MKKVYGNFRVWELPDNNSTHAEQVHALLAQAVGARRTDIKDPPSDLYAGLKHTMPHSNSAWNLIESFSEQGCKCYVVSGGGNVATTFGVNDDSTLAVVWLNLEMPSWFALKPGKSNIRRVSWAFAALHEAGHAWQRIVAPEWYAQQNDAYSQQETTFKQKGKKKTRRDILKGFYTLDYNNLVNWEWPICQELGFPIRRHYNLFDGKPSVAEKARRTISGINDTGKKLFFGYYFDSVTRKGEMVWRRTPQAVMPPPNWTEGAPTRENFTPIPRGSRIRPRKSHPLYERKKVPYTRAKKDPVDIRTYYKLLTKNQSRLTSRQLAGLETINSQDPSVRLPRGNIILHYLPKDFGYFGAFADPTKFSAANHCSIVTNRREITHAVLTGVVSNPITQFYFQGQYGIIFKIDDQYDPFGHAREYAAQQAQEFKDLCYDDAGALGLQVKVFLNAHKFGWLCPKPTFGKQANQKRRNYLQNLKNRRERLRRGKISETWERRQKKIATFKKFGRDTSGIADQPMSFNGHLKKDSTLSSTPLWEKKDQRTDIESKREDEHGKRVKTRFTRVSEREPAFFCSEFVIMCYQLTLHTHDARFPELDAQKSTPNNLEKSLLDHPMWKPWGIIQP